MSTLESTVSMLELLPEADLLRVQNFAKCLFMSQSSDYPFQPLSKSQIIGELDKASQEYSAGLFSDADSLEAELIEKYGL